MTKYIAESVRKKVIESAALHGFNIKLKSNGSDMYRKIMTFNSDSLNQTIYIHKDTAVGSGGIPDHFKVVVHPDFFSKNWLSSKEGVEEYVNRKKNKNLHSHSNYQEFPVFPENNEPCGMSFRGTNLNALTILFNKMSSK